MRTVIRALALALALVPLGVHAANEAFAPQLDSTIAVGASTSNANGTLANAPTNGVFQFRVFNACSTTAFVRLGGSATTSSMPVPTGAIEVLTVPEFTTTVGVILGSGSGCNVYFTTGKGF